MSERFSKTLARYRVVRTSSGYFIANENEVIVSDHTAYRTREEAEAELDKWLGEQLADERNGELDETDKGESAHRN